MSNQPAPSRALGGTALRMPALNPAPQNLTKRGKPNLKESQHLVHQTWLAGY